MISNFLDFEKPIIELETKVEELKKIRANGQVNLDCYRVQFNHKSVF